MGNACSARHPNGNLDKQAYSVSGDRTSVSQRSNSSVVSAQSANRLGNPASSSIHGVIAQRVHDEYLTTPNKIQRSHSEDQQVARVTTGASANQADQLSNQIMHDERLITPEKVQRAHTEDQQVARVTTATSTNQADEPVLSSVHDGARESAEEMSLTFIDNATAPVTTAATANQPDEPTHIIESNEEENRFYDISLEADEACKESKKSDLLPPPTMEDEDREVDDACKESKKSDLLPPPTMEDEDRDECPICLDGYNEENPRIVPECKHQYHLGCILEWMERSNTCPVCDKV